MRPQPAEFWIYLGVGPMAGAELCSTINGPFVYYQAIGGEMLVLASRPLWTPMRMIAAANTSYPYRLGDPFLVCHLSHIDHSDVPNI